MRPLVPLLALCAHFLAPPCQSEYGPSCALDLQPGFGGGARVFAGPEDGVGCAARVDLGPPRTGRLCTCTAGRPQGRGHPSRPGNPGLHTPAEGTPSQDRRSRRAIDRGCRPGSPLDLAHRIRLSRSPRVNRAGILIADYHYDALGRRVEKVVAAGTTTRYLLDGVEVVEEYDAVGNWQARYVYEDGIDRPRCMDRADIADVNGNQNTTEVLRFHYHQQALGSVTEVTQPTGAVVEWVTYDVYGQPIIRDQQGNVITQSAIANPYLFTGREYDAEDALYFYRASTYDPSLGRFLQRDPLGYRDGPNAYQCCRDRVMTATDPLGREGVDANRRYRSEETREARADRNQDAVNHAIDLVRKYGSEEDKERLEEALENGYTIEFIPVGDERHDPGARGKTMPSSQPNGKKI